MLQQLLPLLRFDGYYVLTDLTGVPDILSRIKPIFRSLVRGRDREPQVAELKPWVRVAVTAYLMALVPTLLFLFVAMVMSAPRIVATVHDSFGLQLDRLQVAEGLAETGVGAVAILALVLPVAAMTLSISQVSRMGARGLVRWSRGNASRTVAAAVVATAGRRRRRLHLVAERRLRAHPAGRAGHDRRDAREGAGRRPRITARQDSRLAGPGGGRRVPVPRQGGARRQVARHRKRSPGRAQGRRRNHGLAQEARGHRDHRHWGADPDVTGHDPRLDEHHHRAHAGDDPRPNRHEQRARVACDRARHGNPHTRAEHDNGRHGHDNERDDHDHNPPHRTPAPRRPGRDDPRRSYGACGRRRRPAMERGRVRAWTSSSPRRITEELRAFVAAAGTRRALRTTCHVGHPCGEQVSLAGVDEASLRADLVERAIDGLRATDGACAWVTRGGELAPPTPTRRGSPLPVRVTPATG